MIFVTVGTNEAPFDRLVAAVAALPPGEKLVVQTGSSNLRPAHATCHEYLPYERVLEHCRHARVVVTHAGVGSVMTAMSCGKRPIVVPRLARYGEAVDDHQLDWARRLIALELVTVVEDVGLLATALRRAAPPQSPGIAIEDRLGAELRAYLTEEIGQPALLPSP